MIDYICEPAVVSRRRSCGSACSFRAHTHTHTHTIFFSISNAARSFRIAHSQTTPVPLDSRAGYIYIYYIYILYIYII